MAAARVVATAEVVEVVVVVTVGEMVGGRMAMVVRAGPTFALWCTVDENLTDGRRVGTYDIVTRVTVERSSEHPLGMLLAGQTTGGKGESQFHGWLGHSDSVIWLPVLVLRLGRVRAILFLARAV